MSWLIPLTDRAKKYSIKYIRYSGKINSKKEAKEIEDMFINSIASEITKEIYGAANAFIWVDMEI